jgi:hypothetical protein
LPKIGDKLLQSFGLQLNFYPGTVEHQDGFSLQQLKRAACATLLSLCPYLYFIKLDDFTMPTFETFYRVWNEDLASKTRLGGG